MIEASGKTAAELVKGLAGQPVLLAMLALNAIGIGGAVWYLAGINKRNADLFAVVLKACLPTGG
jgi:hypothetical protein